MNSELKIKTNTELKNEINKLNSKLRNVCKEIHIIKCYAKYELQEQLLQTNISKLEEFETAKLALESKMNELKQEINKNNKKISDMRDTYNLQATMYQNQPLTKENYEMFYENYNMKYQALEPYLETKKVGDECYLINKILP